jgi:hypothetical protein
MPAAQFFGIKGFGFTKENELFVGRVAQLGFAAALVGEAVTGVGPLAQLGAWCCNAAQSRGEGQGQSQG